MKTKDETKHQRNILRRKPTRTDKREEQELRKLLKEARH